jgi:hypothetical protein
VSEGIISNVVDFKVVVEIITSHMSLLVELGNIMEGEVNTKLNATSQTHTLKITSYKWKSKVTFYRLLIRHCKPIVRLWCSDLSSK